MTACGSPAGSPGARRVETLGTPEAEEVRCPPASTWTISELVERVSRLAPPGGRAVLGLTGPPGVGKSTLAARLVDAMAGSAVLVAMDGFHLADPELDRLGRRDRKGAPDTFDAAGYVNLLQRLRDRVDDVVYAPVFYRHQEQAVAGALPVPADVPLIITEGNYLLADGPFRLVRDLLTQAWYLDLDSDMRRDRLLARHISNGRPEEQARQWTTGSDERNAGLIEATRARADLVLRLRGSN